MKREEVIDTLRVYLETQVYGTGLIPAKKSLIGNREIGYREFKLQFGEESFKTLSDKVTEYKYKDVMGMTYESLEDAVKIRIYFYNRSPLTIKTTMKRKWCHFTSTSSVMKCRWGDYEVGKFLFSKGEKGIENSPLVPFTRKPFDFNLNGDLVILDDNERWLGYLILGENASILYHEGDKPSITRKLEIEGYKKRNVIVKEVIDYYFAQTSRTWYRTTNYYEIDFSMY